MSARNSSKPHRAVIYLRVSTKKRDQVENIDTQRDLVTRWAEAHGYRVLRYYQDVGVAGHEIEKRPGFMGLLADAERGDFDVVLCLDVDRFGRFDALDASGCVKRLRGAGVRLVTVNQGEIDWDGLAGQIVYTVQQGVAKEYSVKLSERVCGYMASLAQQGRPLGGVAPYGYRWEYREELHGSRPVLKPVRLVPDPERAELVRGIFRDYHERDTSLAAIRDGLKRRGAPAPGGRHWYATTVRGILANPVYKGDLVWNRRHLGTYHGVQGGQATRRRLTKTREHNPPSDWFVARGAHEPLVDPAVWEAVQRRFAERAMRRTPLPGGGDFHLTGLVWCMHCGQAMFNQSDVNRGKRYPGLICRSFSLRGECERYKIRQAPLVATVLRLVERHYADPKNLARLKAELRRRLAQRAGADPASRKALEREDSDLSAKIERGIESLLTAPAQHKDAMARKLDQWQERQRQARKELEALSRPVPTGADTDARVDAAAALLPRLRQEIENADPARVRALLRQLITRIDCWFDRVPYGRKLKSRLREGVIHVRPGLVGEVEVSGGPRRMPTGETRW
jgi:DNA invertase Pin-like site-specific DNA recombinase